MKLSSKKRGDKFELNEKFEDNYNKLSPIKQLYTMFPELSKLTNYSPFEKKRKEL